MCGAVELLIGQPLKINHSPRFYFVAGERSGDLHGGNLIMALKDLAPSSTFRGFGGDDMAKAGMTLVTHYRDMAFMGFAEVLANLKTISRNMAHCKQDILNWKPDALILIDYPGFNLRMARFAKAHGIKVLWYISPKIWAWNQQRALKLKAVVDRMFVILPFEEEFYRKFDWKVDYVGNPTLDAIRKYKPDPLFPSRLGLDPTRTIAVLPGSRKQELTRILPEVSDLFQKFPEYQFAVSAVDNLDASLYAGVNAPNAVLVWEHTYDLLSHSVAAIVTSGTATLETALFRVPQVVVYRTSPVTYAIGKRLVKVDFISLVNLVAGKEVVRELIQGDATADEMASEVRKLVADQSYRTRILKGYDDLFRTLDRGSASTEVARLIFNEIGGS